MNIKQTLRGMKLIYPAMNAARRVLGRTWMRACHAAHGVDRRTVLFSSYAGGGYSGNPRAVSEALHALRPDLRILWEFLPDHKPADLPGYVDTVAARSLAAVRAFATAGCIVADVNRPVYMLKFPGQLYVQTWHGDRGFKKILNDMKGDIHFPDGAMMDLAVSGSRFGSDVFRTAFEYRGEIMESGCPRNDVLVNAAPTDVEAARAALGIPDGTRVLLYAPTFRNADSGSAMTSRLSLERVRARLEATTGEPWICLSRGHELNTGLASDAQRDVTRWPDVSQLLLACDMVITDYSSIGGDFMLLGRPAIYYQPDLSEYLASERELYFDVDQSPLLVVHSEDALIDLLSRPIDGSANCKACLDFFGACETGHSARDVAAWISERIPGEG